MVKIFAIHRESGKSGKSGKSGFRLVGTGVRNVSDYKDDHEYSYDKAIKSVITVFGNNAFRLRKIDENGNGQWVKRVNASVFQVLSVSLSSYDRSQVTQKADAIFEEYLDLISTDRRWFDSVSKNTGNVNEIKYAFKTWIERLEKIMKLSIPLDKERIFSKVLKDELYKQEKQCAICQQEIKTINDAALDHEEHYWRSGKTIPSNARLVHRICNQKRSR